ncbi:MAG: small conductance mechanosensitive channel [Verrucomicrobiota bacterium]|jgi:small conductance mechanosensitive channel|nr:small conductance mechanosensitive channel [Verrucomicrobiota bacterium]MDK2962716.1 small conductance mechanosensitive channel [Verrucomicrobiota bacterium]
METNGVQGAVGPILHTPPEWLVTAQELLTKFGLKIAAAVLIIVIGRWVAKFIEKIVQKTMARSKADPAIISFTGSMVHVALMVFVVLAALGQVGVQTTSFVAVIGAAGLAVGLALQGSLANFAAGVLIIIFRLIKAGDYIEGAGTAGVVKAIHIFTTTLITLDNKRVIVPNAKLTEDNIINYSAEGRRRLDLTASISYGDSIDTAKAALMDEICKDSRVLKDPAPFVGVLAMSDSSIDLAVRPWVAVKDYWDVFFALNEAIKKRIEAEGLTIPFPQRDVHLYNPEA